MRTALRFVSTLLLTVAIIWIGFDVWLFWVGGYSSSQSIAMTLVLGFANVVINAWPALALICLSVALAEFSRRKAKKVDAS